MKSKPAPAEIAPQATPVSPLTYLDAAEIVLRQETDGIEMHYRDVTNKALKRKLITTKGLTPDATMSAQLVTDIQRRLDRGDAPRFTSRPRSLLTRFRVELTAPWTC
ncbi:MAG: winged helix-turn-helix domain-containing protein [Chloroflexota bacterium]|nr:winged helix-turn-helix domain-containing protein [Chloroflexota bacterium]